MLVAQGVLRLLPSQVLVAPLLFLAAPHVRPQEGLLARHLKLGGVPGAVRLGQKFVVWV